MNTTDASQTPDQAQSSGFLIDVVERLHLAAKIDTLTWLELLQVTYREYTLFRAGLGSLPFEGLVNVFHYFSMNHTIGIEGVTDAGVLGHFLEQVGIKVPFVNHKGTSPSAFSEVVAG